MIKIIRNQELVNFENLGFEIVQHENCLTDLKNINIFIGENNSGKSRFLRLIINNFVKIYNFNIKLSQYLSGKKETLNDALEKLYNTTNQDIFNVELNTEVIQDNFWKHFNEISIESFSLLDISDNMQKIHTKNWLNAINDIHEIIFKKVDSYFVTMDGKINYTYIPILRGLKPLHFDTESPTVKFDYTDIYSTRVKSDHGYIQQLETGLGINEEIKKRLLGEEKERQIIKDFESYLSENLFGEKVTLIPRYGDNILNIKVGVEEQRSIVDLGDGLQALICILFPIFIKKNEEHIFFIEEPELNLHPSLQKKLINLLSSNIFNRLQFFITTHSAHIIDHQNASIYNFTKEGKKTKITHLNNQSKIVESLNALGYTPSDLLQTNYLIWVEGAADKIYIKYLIDKKYPELLEHRHYSIMFYGGSSGKKLLEDDENISHYININRNFAWIIDSDRCSNSSSDKNYQSSNAIVKKLKNQDIFAWASPYREFENHIDSSLFLEALKHVQRKEKAELLYDDIYSDRFWLKINEKNNSPKINVKLTPKLHDLIKRNKNKIGNIDPNIIKEELQKSIDKTINFSEVEVKQKVKVAEYIIKNNFIPDTHLEKLIKELGARIKKVNGLD
ncbi:MAG TPA: AAA family ATPase [Saprospiraceae bacterium]|jgi:predicted ATP-dependent endonuclease of OLD family|nr:AAA family ATPase [Saprospiraceae bacterium]HMT71717.1 AAA family ATPase [Saprospiraceae bacterium]